MNKNNSTKSFRQQVLIKSILPGLKFTGNRMLFPYTWNGELRYAEIKLINVCKIIKWDKLKI